METEVWPNLFSACRRAGVPVALVNARLSERSARGYRRIGGLAREALQNLSLVAAQTRDDAARLTALGARRVEITGNIKFDATPPGALLELGEAFRSRAAGRRIGGRRLDRTGACRRRPQRAETGLPGDPLARSRRDRRCPHRDD